MSKPIRDTLPIPPTPGGNNLNTIPDAESGRVAPTDADNTAKEDLRHPDKSGKLPSSI